RTSNERSDWSFRNTAPATNPPQATCPLLATATADVVSARTTASVVRSPFAESSSKARLTSSSSKTCEIMRRLYRREAPGETSDGETEAPSHGGGEQVAGRVKQDRRADPTAACPQPAEEEGGEEDQKPRRVRRREQVRDREDGRAHHQAEPDLRPEDPQARRP